MSKVFIGLTDVASCIDDFNNGFKANNIETLSVTIFNRRNPIIRTRADYAIDLSFFSSHNNWITRIIRAVYLKVYLWFLWRKAIKECDIFIFIWSSFKSDFSDVKKLKKMGKKVVFYHVGTDIRWVPAMQQDFIARGVDPYEYPPDPNPETNLLNKLKRLRTAEKYADLIYTIPGAGQLSLRPHKYYHVLINLDQIQENSKQRIKPLIVHSPSKSALKGTKYVQAAIDKLREQGLDFEFQLLEKLPYDQALCLYKKADILVGQMFSPQGGKQEREAMAAGCVVLSSFKKNYIFSKEIFNSEKESNYITECPIVDVSPETLPDILGKMIKDLELRIEIAKKGRPYIEKYHRAEMIVEDMMKSLNSTSRQYDIIPTFFKDEFKPEPQFLHIYNQYTESVSKCSWFEHKDEQKTLNRLNF